MNKYAVEPFSDFILYIYEEQYHECILKTFVNRHFNEYLLLTDVCQ